MGAEIEIGMSDLAEFLPGNVRVKEEAESKGTHKAAAKAESAKSSQSHTRESNAGSEEEEDDADEADESESEEEQESHEQETEEEEDDADEADESESEEEQEGEEEEQSGPVKKLLKRIDKVTAKRREAEESLETAREENEQLKSQLAGAQKIVLQPTPEDPLSDVESLEDLDAKVAAAKRVRTWALANRDGATVKGPNGDSFLEPEQVAAHLASAEAVINDHGPKRKEWIAARQQFATEAKTYYPELFAAGSPAQKNLQACLKAFPDIARYPNAELIIGDALVGQQVRLAKIQAQAKAREKSGSGGSGKGKENEGVKKDGKGVPGKVAPTPSGGSGRSKVSATAKQASESLQSISKKGVNRENVASLMESIIG